MLGVSMKRLLALSIALLASLPDGALAAPGQGHLVEVGPHSSECPTLAELARATNQLSRRDAIVDAPAGLEVRFGFIAGDLAGYGVHAELWSSDAQLLGRRELPARKTCAEAGQSLALLLSLALESPESNQLGSEADAPAPATPVPAPPPPDRDAPVPTRVAPSREPHGFVSLGVGAMQGFVPGSAPFARLALGFEPRPSFVFELGGNAFNRQTSSVEDGEVETRALSVDLRAGVLPLSWSALRTGPLLAARATRIWATGSGFQADRSAAAWLADAGLVWRLQADLGAKMRLGLDGALLAALQRATLTERGADGRGELAKTRASYASVTVSLTRIF
jgi:hypothetical protein